MDNCATLGTKQRLIKTAKLLSESSTELASALLTRKAKTLHDPTDPGKENDSARLRYS